MEKYENTVTVVTDGAYSGIENTALANGKNVNLITTSLTGRETADIMADFEFDEEGTKVIRCPAGHETKSCTYMVPSKQCQVSYHRELCANCPLQDKCHPKIFKRVAKVITSKTAHNRAVFSEPCMGKNSKIMQDYEMVLKQFCLSFVIITIWRTCHVENNESDFSMDAKSWL